MTQQEFETIAVELRPMMYDVGMRYFHSQDDAGDVAQESLLRLWKFCANMDASMNIKGLAVKVAKNCCISMKRKKDRNLFFDAENVRVDDNIPSYDFDWLEAEENEVLIDRMMQDMLAPRERELFELRRLHGMSNDEIEARTGIKKATIQSMVSKARTKLFLELKRRMKQ